MISKAVESQAGTRTFRGAVDYIVQHDHVHELELVGSGISFADRVSYATVPEKAAWTHLRGVTSLETAAVEMEAVAAQSDRCEQPTYHMIVAYAKNEQPTREQIVADTERLLKSVGMEDHQYVLAVHTNTDDLHAHVIANRIGPDGKANQLWHERINRERTGAEIAMERGWEPVTGRHNRDLIQKYYGLDEPPPEPARRMNEYDVARIDGRGELPWQDAARPYVLEAVDRATSWDDLRQRLHDQGVAVKTRETNGRVTGLAFAEGDAADAPGCSASKIDARCRYSALRDRFGAIDAPKIDAPAKETPNNDGPQNPSGQAWADRKGPEIVQAVKSSETWTDLRDKLAERGIVMQPKVRGTQFQGIVFAESHDPNAPGCKGSAIDDSCKKSALEKRFQSPFPYRDGDQEKQIKELKRAGFQQIDTKDRSGKPVRALAKNIGGDMYDVRNFDAKQPRPSRAQRLQHAPAQSSAMARAAPGGWEPRTLGKGPPASTGPEKAQSQSGWANDPAARSRWADKPEFKRVDWADRKTERAQPAHKTQQRPQPRGELRAKTEREAEAPAKSVLRDASGIAANARMRSEYGKYRDDFYAQRRGQSGERDIAWRHEAQQRVIEADRRRDAKTFLKDIVRLATPRGALRRLGYSIVDHAVQTRAKREYARAQQRWTKTKEQIALREQTRDRRPQSYREYVGQRARDGDEVAQTASRYLERAPAGAREQSKTIAPQRAPERTPQQARQAPPRERTLSVSDAKIQIALTHADLTKEDETLRARAAKLKEVPMPKDLDRTVGDARKAREAEVKGRTDFTPDERQRIAQLQNDAKNPLKRNAVEREFKSMTSARDARFEKAWKIENERFKREDMPKLVAEHKQHGQARAQWRREHDAIAGELRTIAETRKTLNGISESLEKAGDKMPQIKLQGPLPQKPVERARAIGDAVTNGLEQLGKGVARTIGRPFGLDL